VLGGDLRDDGITVVARAERGEAAEAGEAGETVT